MPEHHEVAAALYGITFTDYERKLLTTGNGLLDPIERQHRFLLMMALEPAGCPACHGRVCHYSCAAAMPGAEPELPFLNRADDQYQCPICHARLTWHLGLVAGEQWFTLNPGQTITVPDRDEGGKANGNHGAGAAGR